MTRVVEADYLVVGAGATGMAFTDSLIDHADVRVAMVDRRVGVGGHWLDAYPFVQLHQASVFYGVASTLLGGGRVQRSGPEAGLHERATVSEIRAYFEQVVRDRFLESGRVELFTSHEYLGDRQVVSRVSGDRFEVPQRCRIVDARYLAPDIPADTPAPFEVADGARVIPVNDLPRVAEAPREYVVVGSGKTATDACIWLLARGVDPDRICWVRPREPWMIDRALVQPDPAVFLGMVADIDAGRRQGHLPRRLLPGSRGRRHHAPDRPHPDPDDGRAPTLGAWELDLLRTLERVVRRGHLRRVEPGRLVLDEGSVAISPDTVVVHCAASGLQNPPLVPVWSREAIRVQPIRAGSPCFAAALVGYVEATRTDDQEKNRLCPPSPYGNTLSDWAEMNVRGMRAAASFGGEPDIKAWADGVALNPARVPSELSDDAAVQDALARLRARTPAGLARLAELAGLGP